MSEHTLDDLAARLAALGWTHTDQSGEVLGTIEMHRGQSNGDCATIYVGAAIPQIGLDGTLDTDLWQGLGAIRQWQASAEPAPPPAAPVVARDDARIARLEDVAKMANALCDDADPDVIDGAWVVSDAHYWALKAALDDADAPGGG